ncbi:MAG: diguanylate cyclase, partial [Ardenticatenales bacterium]|nr:diguanylate cyclase [Ardenticatenales bacterium]
MRILVVEDDDNIRAMLEELLTSSGHTIFTAHHGQEALERLQAQPVEMVLTDWMMARLDGLELIRRIRSSSFPDYIYIIVLTAKGGKDDVVTALQAGADDYLTKPFDLEELEARITAGERRLSLEQQLRQARDTAIAQAQRDTLTGILNREGIMEQAEAALALAQREGRSMSIALLDLDQFKEINDEHGHLIGDQALQLLSETICRALRTGDWLGRWGGDEFLIVFAGASIAGACQAGERVRRLLSMT